MFPFMTTLQVSDELAQTICLEAATRGVPVEEFLKIVLRRERTLAERRKIEQEQAWWLGRPLSERAKYEGKFIAVHNQQVVDSDEDDSALHQRIRAKYGKAAVLIMPAEGPKEIRIFNPRLVRS